MPRLPQTEKHCIAGVLCAAAVLSKHLRALTVEMRCRRATILGPDRNHVRAEPASCLGVGDAD